MPLRRGIAGQYPSVPDDSVRQPAVGTESADELGAGPQRRDERADDARVAAHACEADRSGTDRLPLLPHGKNERCKAVARDPRTKACGYS